MWCFNVGGDTRQEGLAGYRLGAAYEEVGDAETAILVRKIYTFFFLLLVSVAMCCYKMSRYFVPKVGLIADEDDIICFRYTLILKYKTF